jgi:hypothetical protein
MHNAVKSALIATAVVLGLATSAQAQSSSSPIHHYRYRQPVQRNSSAGVYRRGLYNASPSYNYDPGYPASDTAAALDE